MWVPTSFSLIIQIKKCLKNMIIFLISIRISMRVEGTEWSARARFERGGWHAPGVGVLRKQLARSSRRSSGMRSSLMQDELVKYLHLL
jgi:hypothetical protein